MQRRIGSAGALIGGLAAVLMTGAPSLAQDRGITIVLVEEPDIVDPCHASRSNIGRVIKQNIVETFTEINPADGSITPRLAVGWEQLDPLTWRIKLREGVKFHDGTPFNAETAAISINRTLDKRLDCEIRTKFFGGVTVTPKVVDATTLDITTSTPQPILPTLLGTMTVAAPKTPADRLTREPIGTGPYVLSVWEPGRRIVVDRFAGYWGAKPDIEKANYVWRLESAVRAAMVATGEAGIAPNISPQDATNPKTDFSYLDSETVSLRFTHDIPPLSDVRVRKAINLAIDREAMRGTIFSKDVLLASNLVVPSISGHNATLKPWSYDPAKAKQLLADARAAGVPVDRQIVMIGRLGVYPNATESMEAMLAMLQDIGLNVALQMTEVAQWQDIVTKPYAENRPPSLMQIMHDNNNGDAVFSVYYKYHSQGAQADIADPEIDRIIDAAGSAVNPKRRELYQDLFKRLHEDVVSEIMLYHMVGYTRVNPRYDFKPSISTNSELQLAQIRLKQ